MATGETAATHLHQPAEGPGAIEQRLQPLIDDQKDSRRTDRQPGQIVPGPLQAQEQQGSHHQQSRDPGSTDLIHHHKKSAQGGGDGVTQPKKNGFIGLRAFALPIVSSIAMTTAMAARQASSRHGPRQRNQRRRPLKAGTDVPDRHGSHATSGGCRDPRWLEQRGIKVETAQIAFFSE